MLMEREDELGDLEGQSNMLSSSALNFEQTGIALKKKIMREKIKMIFALVIVIGLSGLLFYYFI